MNAPTSFAAPIAEQIWDMKYRLKGEVPGTDGQPAARVREASVEQTWRRVARALAAAEPEETRLIWEKRFQQALEGFQFLPAGRVMAGAGSGRAVTLFNCFVMGTIPDEMSGIFEMLKEAAVTMQHGGGIGYDFSTIRPEGAPVAGVGADASGPVSFMDVWDAMCRTIMSAGARRGAMMATLRCDHPDIEAFIDAKADPARLRNFNLSVLATDAFMDAVAAGAPWALTFEGRTYKTLPARALWDKIMRATYDYAEPGVIFIDRINARNNLWYCETISATNPCGEQPLPPYGACLLGSINLARLVEEPFSERARIDPDRLTPLVAVAVRMMDNVIDVSRFALEAQAQEARAKRRIGLGVTGLADALAMAGLTYGEDDAVAQTERWLKIVQGAAYRASVELAREKGAFPLFDADCYLDGETVRALDPDIRAGIAEHGIRNALLTSIAPTGTISLYAGNVSSGVEPIFAHSYRRKVLMPDGSKREEEVVDYAVARWREQFGAETPLPPSFVSAQTLSPEAHLRMQAAAQKYVDSAISKTINMPESVSFEAFKQVYRLAYESGCKGCTTYRPNAVTGSVLSAAPSDAPAEETATEAAPAHNAAAAAAATEADLFLSDPLNRPEALPGATYKLKWPGSPHALYITVNDVVVGDQRRPFELFVNSKNMEHYAWIVALTRMISAVFRRGGDVSFVVEELKAVFDPRGGAWMQGAYVPSILAAIGGVIERHMIEIGFLEPGAALRMDPAYADAAPVKGA
ncbi:MAG: adenosylcobalamin-dependent ribonucleoside-diphosphate reductase, partial [Pseudomonadota bacterium]